MAGTTLDTDINRSTKDELSKLYHVIILNDDDHTFDYVIEMLQAVFAFPYATALAHTMEADATGSSIVLTTGLKKPNRNATRSTPMVPIGGCPTAADLSPH